MSLGKENNEAALIRVIRTTPIIDHHAHPLVKLSAVDKYPLMSITTEASGTALEDTRSSLAHYRAVKYLSNILNCESTWAAVHRAIEDKQHGNYTAWVEQCLSGIQTVLVDDGLDTKAIAEPYNYLDQFTATPCKQIIRIESLAEGLIDEACAKFATANEALGAVMEGFAKAVLRGISDPHVVGFKSVICYRTGLALQRQVDVGRATRVFQSLFEEKVASREPKSTRLQHPGLSEYFVHRLADLIRDTKAPFKKPIQFHTGLGDNDITLSRSSPAHLQEFIREYPTVPIVLLHAGWPYTRETGYLATTYSNVYADIGEVFPCLSRDGQESVVREIFEFCPSTKVLWSTDGHWYPETYLLAVEQIRLALQNVLIDYVHKGDMTWSQASRLVENLLFNNANKLYSLRLQLRPLPPKSQKELSHLTGDFQTLTAFVAGQKSEPKYLRVYWNDYAALPRVKTMPMWRVWELLREGGDISVGVTTTSLGLLPNDTPIPGIPPSGEIRLHPDLQSLRLGPRDGHISAMGNFKQRDGLPVQLCPRTLLRKVVEKAARQGLSFLLGFEIEFVLLRRGDKPNEFKPLNDFKQAWAEGRAMEHEAAIVVVEEAVAQLANAGVYIEQVHPESADGQYEIILPKAPVIEAVDTLLFARDVLSNCATAKGFRMTLHPKPWLNACGTAAHVHMSIASSKGDEPQVYESFYAGILKHLRAITAFTYCNPASYERALDRSWAGGTWVTYGTQNREAPLRKIAGSHWEFRCMDGLANPYLALNAILLAGLNGILTGESLAWTDNVDDPAVLSDEDRAARGITKQLPSSLPEAMDALKEDEELCGLLGGKVVQRYLAVKTTEEEILDTLNREQRWQWIVERY